MSTIRGNKKEVVVPDQVRLPFALPIVQGKEMKKKCCKKYKKGKRCKHCPKA